MILMALRVHHLLPSFPTTRPLLRLTSKFQIQSSCVNYYRISCFSKADSDMELAMDLEKMKRQMVETEEAMKRSRKVLYGELCLYLGLGKEELGRKWERMGEQDKWVLAEEFVSDWGSSFHPLSAKSVKELVDQHLFHDDKEEEDSSSSSSDLFSGLKKLMG